MARDKSSDVKLLKLTNKVTPDRVITMGYVLYQSEIIKTNTEVTFNLNFLPLVKNSVEGLPEDGQATVPAKASETAGDTGDEVQQSVTATVHSGNESEFKKDNRLMAHADLITKTISFPHMNKFKLDKAYRGYGLGTYAMSDLTSNLKSMFPDFKIDPVYFFFDHKGEDEDRDAFFRFMEKFGFWFSFDDDNNNKGLLNLEKAEMFNTVIKKNTIAELELAPFIRGLFQERDGIRKELGRIKNEYKKNSTYMNRFEKDQTIRFLINVIIGMALVMVMILFI